MVDRVDGGGGMDDTEKHGDPRLIRHQICYIFDLQDGKSTVTMDIVLVPFCQFKPYLTTTLTACPLFKIPL